MGEPENKAKRGRRPIMRGCTLGAMRAAFCTIEDCRSCGWNVDEAERRKEQIKKHGLTTGYDGIRQLVIRRRETR